jgi:hypothetical protein
MSEKLEKLIAIRSLHAPPVPKDNSAYEAIKAYVEDTTGKVILSDENKKIFSRWKNIHQLRLDGYTHEQVIVMIQKLHDICEKTVRRDLKQFYKIFRYDFDADYELQIMYLKYQAFLQKATNAGDLNLAEKFGNKIIELAKYFKGDGSLPDASQFNILNISITANPEDVGLKRVPYSTEELMKMFKSQKKKIELKEEAETISYEDK